jgi:sterol desaturase/sphingolipid hydroxylase (fatty acid hydroxylase superfamily)
MHINGAIHDTAIFVGLFVSLALWSGKPFALAFVAALVSSYVAEEWVHHSVHFYGFKNPYFQYIRRHHLYHHSPRGDESAFGLTSGLWDFVCGTRIPAADRALLYGGRAGRERSVRPVAPVRGNSAPHSFA